MCLPNPHLTMWQSCQGSSPFLQDTFRGPSPSPSMTVHQLLLVVSGSPFCLPTMAPSGLGGFGASSGVLSAAHRKLSTASLMLDAASQGPSTRTHCLTISTPCSYTVALWGAGDCGSHHFGRSKSLGCVCIQERMRPWYPFSHIR